MGSSQRGAANYDTLLLLRTYWAWDLSSWSGVGAVWPTRKPYPNGSCQTQLPNGSCQTQLPPADFEREYRGFTRV